MSESTEENVEETPQHQVTVGPRMMGATVPVERSKDFRNSTLRLISWMRPERFRLILVLSTAVISVMMSVVGPKILGNATNVIISGVQAPTGIDFPELHRTLLIVVGLYLGSAAMAYFQGFLLAGVIHRTMRRLRSAVENKINRLPLGYIDRTPRGDLLSRVTNDIDNIAQSLAQSLSMLFISLLTVVGAPGTARPRRVRVTPGNTAPDSSVTTPRITPVVVCAHPDTGLASSTTTARTQAIERRMSTSQSVTKYRSIAVAYATDASTNDYIRVDYRAVVRLCQ